MERQGLTITADEAKAYASKAANIAHAVESLQKHNGWQVFLACFYNKKEEIYAKEDYATIEAFHADRTAIKIVEEILEEFKGFVEDAEGAAEILIKLTESDDQTPVSLAIDPIATESREG